MDQRVSIDHTGSVVEIQTFGNRITFQQLDWEVHRFLMKAERVRESVRLSVCVY